MPAVQTESAGHTTGALRPGVEVLVQFDRTPPFIGKVVEVEPGGFVLVTTPDQFDPVARFPAGCLYQKT